ncbi:MAG TPA: hexose kinase [Candidatus Borkfalkia avistercoris]|uniref:Tagatose-6-phosphate kinase n=1 Tax=Candidatus Borkfalkia avistercoris TaxID=2838504 RepID=A0A9D2D0C5_9FIRM|nr:hexose kinase [Candidatus Borkfalkia avistercoris]
MILTVCLNPCTDVTIEVDALNVGKLNHVKNKTLSFTGKALNVAIGVARLRGQSHATGFMYNENGSLFEQALDREGVSSVFIWNRGRVRENYKFIDNKSMLTEVNDVGEPIAENKQAELVDLVANLSKRSDVVVISGSLPRGIESDYYIRLFNAVPDGKLKVADCDGPRLLAALQAGMDLVKPNKDELQNTLGQEFRSREDLLKGCRTLIDKGAKRVLLSLGKRGAIITDGSKNYYCRSINVAVNSTVGAGDGMLAAASMLLEQGADLPDILRAGVAAGTATVTTFGQISFTKEKYDEIYANLTVEEFK